MANFNMSASQAGGQSVSMLASGLPAGSSPPGGQAGWSGGAPNGVTVSAPQIGSKDYTGAYKLVTVTVGPNVIVTGIPAWYVTDTIGTKNIVSVTPVINKSTFLIVLDTAITGGSPTLHFNANDPHVLTTNGKTVNAGTATIILV